MGQGYERKTEVRPTQQQYHVDNASAYQASSHAAPNEQCQRHSLRLDCSVGHDNDKKDRTNRASCWGFRRAISSVPSSPLRPCDLVASNHLGLSMVLRNYHSTTRFRLMQLNSLRAVPQCSTVSSSPGRRSSDPRPRRPQSRPWRSSRIGSPRRQDAGM